MMTAWFQSDIGGAARCEGASLLQSYRFGVGAAAGLCPAATDDTAFIDDHATDRRVRRDPPEPALRQRKGMAHVADIGVSRRRRLVRVRAR